MSNSSTTTKSILDDFDKRHLEEIDLQFKQIEAIQYYEKVKAEKEGFEQQLAGAFEKIREIETSTSQEIQNLRNQLQDSAVTKRELSDAEERITGLRSRISELEALKTIAFVDSGEGTAGNNTGNIAPSTSSKTLSELEEMFLSSKEEEIKRRAEGLFGSKMDEWERAEKPRLVSEAAAQQLKQMIETVNTTNLKDHLLSSPQAEPPSYPLNEGSQQQLSSEIYEKLASIIQREVEKRVDLEFEGRVEIKSQERAEEKLEQLVTSEWQKFYNQTILPKAEELETNVMNNVFSFLKGPWHITCRVCGTIHQSILLSPEQVESLLSNTNLELQCYGTFLRSQSNWFDNLIGTAHTFRIELLGLIQDRLAAEN